MLAALVCSVICAVLPLTTTTSSAASSVHTELCSVAGAVTSLRVSRGIPTNPTTFSFPRLVLVQRATLAQSVAVALCALPAGPSGMINCPADFGFDYRLSFTAPGYDVAYVSLDPTGCQWIKGIDPTRWVEQSPRFYRILGAAMGLDHANNATFRGTLQNS
jgi:hypothetical protein